MRHLLYHGMLSGLLAGISCSTYFFIYQFIFDSNFNKIVNIGSIFGASIFGCLLMASGYFFIYKSKKLNLFGVLNILITIFSFISIIGPVGISLPLDIESPELFVGLAVPMHFFPALSFFTIEPFFRRKI